MSRGAAATLGGFGFAGEQRDDEAGLVYLRARSYDPATGRFLQADPAGMAGSGPNLYAYAGNNPTGYVDPSGEILFLAVPVALVAGTALVGGLALVAAGCAAATACNRGVQDFWGGVLASPGATDLGTGWHQLENLGALAGALGQGLLATPRYAGDTWATSGGMDVYAGDSFHTLAASDSRCPNPYGKGGCPAHKQVALGVEATVRSRGLLVRTEYPVDTPSGSKPRRFVDVAGLDPETRLPIEFHQIGVQLKSGLPVTRERLALQEIQVATGIRPQFHP